MTEQWRALHVYTSAIDALLLEVIGPFFEAHEAELEHGFWERHYAGGPHVRIRLRAAPDLLANLVEELRARTESWLDAHPSQPGTYSATRAAALLRAEGVDPATEDLEHRHSVVIEGRYPGSGKVFASTGARQLAESFYRASGPVALAILRGIEPARHAVYRLYVALALFVGRGSYPRGAVSFKSHWENYATRLPEAVVARVHASYAANHQLLVRILDDVQKESRTGFKHDDLVARWQQVLTAAREETAATLERGEPLIEVLTREAMAAVRDDRVALSKRWSTFLDIQWANEEFLARAQEDPRSLRPRALVNLLYHVVSAVGMSPIDRMALCHHCYRAIEEACNCNLDEVLSHNVDSVLRREQPSAQGKG